MLEGVIRKGDDHPLDVELAQDLRELGRRAEQRQPLQARHRLLRPVVDEADEVDAVLGVLQDLARDELAHLAGADNDRVLHIGDSRAADRACGCA